VAQGIETVRRDNCLLVRNVVTTCLEKILIGRDVEGAVQFVKNTISDLLLNKIDLSLLVISKVRFPAAAAPAPHVPSRCRALLGGSAGAGRHAGGSYGQACPIRRDRSAG
jgi:hypothetical protein